MSADDRHEPEEAPRMAHEDYLSRLLFLISGMRFTRAVVRQAAHYAEQVLPTREDDEGERDCLAAARAWGLDASAENTSAVQRAADLITANAMEGIHMVEAVGYVVRAALAGTPLEAAREAAKAVEDAAGRKAGRGRGDYMGRAVARQAGLKLAQDWQAGAAMELTFDDTYDDELPPFPPLPELPANPDEVVSLFKAIYSEEAAYRARDLAVLLDFMTAEQQLLFKQAVVRQAVRYAEPLLPPPEEDLGERSLLIAVRLWADQPTEENTRAAGLLPEQAKHPTPSLQWTFTWAADTQPVPHATPSVAYAARAAQFPAGSAAHEARMAAAELAQARARQWQAAAAAAIARGEEPPEPAGTLNISTGGRGAYLEGRLALLVQRMTPAQRHRFKRFVVGHAVEQAERVLPPEPDDRGHRRCLDAARLWLDNPSEENAKAARDSAWVRAEPPPQYPRSTAAESAVWLAARGAAEAAAEADPHRAALVGNLSALLTVVLEGEAAGSDRSDESRHRTKVQYHEAAWRILQGQEPSRADDQAALSGESLGALVHGLAPAQLHALAGALERQARWYSERAGGPPPTPWLDRPESGERVGIAASVSADLARGLENQVESALRALAGARTAGAEVRPVALVQAAERVWKAASYAGERQAAEWQVETAWAIMHATELPPLDVGAQDSGNSTPEPTAGSGRAASSATTSGSDGGTQMAGSWESDRMVLEALLSEDPDAEVRYGKLEDFEKRMCFEWISDAPTPLLREQRIYRLARRLWLTSLNPYYDTGPDLMLPELDDIYGLPRLFEYLSPEEKALALEEGRVLGANHYRNYDDAGTSFRIVPPGDRLNDDLLVVYARPCRLSESTISWLNRNGWETMKEVYEWFDLPYDVPPLAPPPEPLRIEDTTAGELRPESDRHTGPVLAVVVTSDGARAVSASADGTLRVWDTSKGVSTHVLAGHSGPVRAVALMRDGRVAVSGSDDGTVRMWDADTGEPLRRLSGHEGAVVAVAPMPGGAGVVSASADSALAIWDMGPNPGTVVLRGHSGPILDVAVAPDGGRVVSASDDGTLVVWDVNTEPGQQVLRGHTAPVTAAAFTPDGKYVVSASDDGTLRVWNPATGRTRALLLGHNGPIRALRLLPDSQRFMSASDDGTFRVWHVGGGALGKCAGHEGPVTGVAAAHHGWGERFVWLSPGSLLLVQGMSLPKDSLGVVSASSDGTLRLWDMGTETNVVVLDARVPFTCCAISAGGETLAAGDEQGQMHFLQLAGVDRLPGPV